MILIFSLNVVDKIVFHKEEVFYMVATRRSLGRQLMRAPLDGAALPSQITASPGWHSVKHGSATHTNASGDDGEDEQYFYAINELAIHKKDTSSMINVKVSLDGNFLNTYWSDGLIISTPTGSTAYNLSCGGPIVTPGCQVHIITPIAPHNLNVRPMVIPDHMPITLNVEGRGRSYLMSIDGKSHSIKQGQEIVIQKADFMINVVKFENNNFLDTIRNKMHWGIDKRN